MAYLTKSKILSRPVSEGRELAKALHVKTASQRYHIFLSHSHHDADVIENMAAILGDHANSIYVDWKDASMPAVTNPSTAAAIKLRIKGCKKFMLLATDNALASRWVPWELGIGDLSNGMDNVCIIPVSDPTRTWSGNEDVGIYSRLETVNNQYYVYAPGRTDLAVPLGTWLTRP